MTVPFTFATATNPIPLANLDANFAAVGNSENVTYTPPFTGAVAETVEAKLAQTVSVKDFGAVGDGVTDDTAAIQAALNYIASKSSTSIGGTVFVPSGRYLIKNSLGISLGTTIQGERSGLVGIGSNPSTGTVFVVSATKSNGTQWISSTLNGTNVVTGRVLFYMTGGGGVVSLQDFGAIPENTYTSDAIFFQTGQQAVPYENSGVSQGFFNGIRPTSFYAVFKGSVLNDTNFVNCGFEFNTVVFDLGGKLDGSNGSFSGRFVNCVFFGSFIFFNISKCTSTETVFTNCNFDAQAGIATSAAFNIADSSANIYNWTFASCTADNTISALGNNDFFRVIAASPTIDGITLTGCAFNKSSVDINYISPTGSFKGISYSGCVFKDSNINVQYETKDLVMTNNTFIGNSSITMNGVVGFTFGNNSFYQSTATNNVDLSASPNNNYVIVGNLFQSGKGVLKHSGDTDYKIYANLNQSDLHNP